MVRRQMRNVLILLFLFPVLISGDNTQNQSIHQIASESDVVIVGTITTITPSQITSGADTIIVSDLTVTINELLKSTTASPVTIRIEGGTVAGFTMRNSATPPMSVGLRAVMFLSTVSSARRTLIRKGQGFLELNSDDTVVGKRGLTLAQIRQQVM